MITVEIREGVGLVELDRHERRNALDAQHCRLLTAAMADVLDGGARAVVVTGVGTSFCAGADLSQPYGDGFRADLYTALHAVADAPVPVIAAVNGPAIGAGTQLAIACDLRVAAPAAVFGVPTARNAFAVDPWTIRRLTQVGGGGTARALLLACEQIGAELAHARGLVDRLGDRAAALALAADIATMAPVTLRYNKLVLDSVDPGPAAAVLDAAFEACWRSEDLVESQRARAEDRPPVFTGR